MVASERDLEDRDQLVAFDLDLSDVGFDDRFPLPWRAVVEHACEVLAEALDGGGAGCPRGDLGGGSEFVPAGSELVELGREVAD
ncbi:MAG: hypothetical protein ACM30G_07545, partial [Micromonosporaceae bacterium]